MAAGGWFIGLAGKVIGVRLPELPGTGREGVGEPEDEGDWGSVIHRLETSSVTANSLVATTPYRCDFVATILATVWAKVEVGVT